MVEVVQRRTFQAGDKIFKEGDEGDVAYVVQSGEVEIIKVNDNNEEVIGVIGVGGIFGEMALIDSKPRMAMARTSKSATIIVVTKQMFDEKMKSVDPFIRGLLNIFVDQIRSISN